eukprot:795030-Pyramimonas_sp.AAC.1
MIAWNMNKVGALRLARLPVTRPRARPRDRGLRHEGARRHPRDEKLHVCNGNVPPQDRPYQLETSG